MIRSLIVYICLSNANRFVQLGYFSLAFGVWIIFSSDVP